MPIVLTTNDVVLNPDHTWNDIEGVQYHYPNGYKGRVQTGEPFVYYRGVHRPGGKRGPAEYLGHGIIGEIRIDPASPNERLPNRLCAIEKYMPFAAPVRARRDDGFYETITERNGWRVSVRAISPEAFRAILEAGSSTAAATPTRLSEVDSLIVPREKLGTSISVRAGGYRRSTRAKEVGDWAEAAALTFIRDTLKATQVVHRAAIRETPGWDLDYIDEAGALQRVEVKGTVGGAFATVDLTAGELKAAQAHGDSYWLYLVAGCFSDHPRIQRIRNPAAQLTSGAWVATPSLFSVRLS